MRVQGKGSFQVKYICDGFWDNEGKKQLKRCNETVCNGMFTRKEANYMYEAIFYFFILNNFTILVNFTLSLYCFMLALRQNLS